MLINFFYRANLADLNFRPGEESLEVKLFTEEEIPWEELAFPVVVDALKYYFKDKKNNQFVFRSETIIRSHKKKKKKSE